MYGIGFLFIGISLATNIANVNIPAVGGWAVAMFWYWYSVDLIKTNDSILEGWKKTIENDDRLRAYYAAKENSAKNS